MSLRKNEEIRIIMSSESFFKGLSLSSTPIQSLQDSGYFEKSQERHLCRSHIKFSNSYSPIKEYVSFRNLPKDLEHDSGLDSWQSRISLLDYVNFTESDLSSDLEHCEVSKLGSKSQDFNYKNEINTFVTSKPQGYSNASDLHTADFIRCPDSKSQSAVPENTDYEVFPICKTKEIDFSTASNFKHLTNSSVTSAIPLVRCRNNLNVQRTNTKRIKVDFIHELNEMNCKTVISSILCHLSAEELCRACCVSKEWKVAILEDKDAKDRRAKLIEEKISLLTGPSKENRLGTRCGLPREHKMAFSDLTNKSNSAGISLESNRSSNSRFDSFLKEAKNGQRLLKCPQCCYASKCDTGKNYICTHCCHTFCGDCFGPAFKHHTCYKSDLSKTFIDSKKSKKNLRRLLRKF